jgi:hypothetical protein
MTPASVRKDRLIRFPGWRRTADARVGSEGGRR